MIRQESTKTQLSADDQAAPEMNASAMPADSASRAASGQLIDDINDSGLAQAEASPAALPALHQRGSRVPPVIVVPPGAWHPIDFREFWSYRQVLSVFLWRYVARRYRQTLLGPLWFVLTPVVRMLVFSFALGAVLGLPSEGVPYPLFTYTALLPWELFAVSVIRSSESLVAYEHIISKVYFPRLIVPVTEALCAAIDFGLSFIILLVMLLGYGFPLTARLLIIPFLVGLTLAIALSIGLVFAVLQVRYRDMSNLLAYVVQFWFYATPVAYSASVVAKRLPQSLLHLYQLNPMNGVVEGFRWALLGTGRAPDTAMLILGVLIWPLLGLSAMVFTRTEHSIVDLV